MIKNELKEIEDEIMKLEAEGKKISVQNKMKLKKLQRKRDKLTSPIESSLVFVSEDNILNTIKSIDIDKIKMPIFNDRTGIDGKKIEELAQSIQHNGLLQPIVVQSNEDDTFTKIAGRRRILATKLNGERQIKAIILSQKMTQKEFNLLVLHENTQREDLSIYDKVRFIVNFIEEEFATNQIEAKKICHRVNNLKKGNLIEKDIKLEEKAKILEKILKETQIFSSVANLVKHLSVLDMNSEILEFLDNNQITFGMALLFDKNKDKHFVTNQTFLSITKEIVSKEMSLNEAEKYFSTHLAEKKNNQNLFLYDVRKKVTQLNKIALLLNEKQQQDFKEELASLLNKYRA